MGGFCGRTFLRKAIVGEYCCGRLLWENIVVGGCCGRLLWDKCGRILRENIVENIPHSWRILMANNVGGRCLRSLIVIERIGTSGNIEGYRQRGRQKTSEVFTGRKAGENPSNIDTT